MLFIPHFFCIFCDLLGGSAKFLGVKDFRLLSIIKICSCRLFLYPLSMPYIQLLDFQDVVLSVDNSMSKIVVFVCPRLYPNLIVKYP